MLKVSALRPYSNCGLMKWKHLRLQQDSQESTASTLHKGGMAGWVAQTKSAFVPNRMCCWRHAPWRLQATKRSNEKPVRPVTLQNVSSNKSFLRYLPYADATTKSNGGRARCCRNAWSIKSTLLLPQQVRCLEQCQLHVLQKIVTEWSWPSPGSQLQMQ